MAPLLHRATITSTHRVDAKTLIHGVRHSISETGGNPSCCFCCYCYCCVLCYSVSQLGCYETICPGTWLSLLSADRYFYQYCLIASHCDGIGMCCEKKTLIGWRNVWNMRWRAPDQEVDQRGRGQRLCRKTVEHAIWTRRMLWIMVDGRSW